MSSSAKRDNYMRRRNRQTNCSRCNTLIDNSAWLQHKREHFAETDKLLKESERQMEQISEALDEISQPQKFEVDNAVEELQNALDALQD